MKKIISTVVVFLTVSYTVVAQKSEQIIDEKIRKNEINIDILGVAHAGMGNPSYYFGYKKAKEKLKYRIAFTGGGAYMLNQNSLVPKFDQVIITDSSMQTDQSFTNTDVTWLRIGTEKTKSKEFVSFYYGIDFIIGREQENKYKTTNFYVQDIFNYSETTLASRSNSLNVGVSPLIGLDFKINQVYALGVFIPMNLYFRHSTNSSTKDIINSFNSDMDFKLLFTAKF